MNKEKQEIKQIISKIDTIMFGGRYKQNGLDYFTEIAPGALMGMMAGLSISVGIEPRENIFIFPPIGALVGGAASLYFCRSTKDSIYKDYELAYLNLSREEQLEVLKLSKRLFEIYKNKNKKRINKYLQIDDEATMFDEFESNHPQFKLLTKEEVENIHKKGKLTPIEKFNEWRKLNYCPFSIDSNFRCRDYETCRDCTVALANEKEEWDKMETVPAEFIGPYNDDYKQMRYKDSTAIVKRKTRNA